MMPTAQNPSPQPVSADSRRADRRRPAPRLAVLAAAAVVASVALWLVGVQSTLRDRARSPYPQTQNGLTFLAHHTTRTHSASPTPLSQFAAWIKRRIFPNEAFVTDTEFPSIEVALPLKRKPGQFLATARSPSGETFALGCEDLFAGAFPAVSAGSKPAHTFVHLPTVPGSYEWLDVTLDDKKGHRGTWRVRDLPHLKHALSPNAPLHETETVHNVTMEARAWWDAQAAPPIDTIVSSPGTRNKYLPLVFEATATVTPAALSRPSQAWGVEIVSVTPEWDDPFRKPLAKGGTSGLSQNGSERNTTGPGISHADGQAAAAPHPTVQHVARIEAKLNQYDFMEETVTFRNVPLENDGHGLRVKVPAGGLSLLTPSGVRVRLTKRPPPSPTTEPLGFNDVAVNIELSPENGTVPGSPLQKRVGAKPLRMGRYVQWNNKIFTSIYSSSGDHIVRLSYNKRLPHPVLPEFTVHVTQEATLQSVPATFIVPVKVGKPKQEREWPLR